MVTQSCNAGQGHRLFVSLVNENFYQKRTLSPLQPRARNVFSSSAFDPIQYIKIHQCTAGWIQWSVTCISFVVQGAKSSTMQRPWRNLRRCGSLFRAFCQCPRDSFYCKHSSVSDTTVQQNYSALNINAVDKACCNSPSVSVHLRVLD